MEDVKKSQEAQHEDAAPDFRNMKMLLEERRTCCGATVIGMQNFREPQRLFQRLGAAAICELLRHSNARR